MSITRQYCTFFLEGRLFGIEVRNVREVLRSHPLTRVPLAPGEVAGLVNLRGQIATAIDLRRAFGLPDRDPSSPPMCIIVPAEEGVACLLVDAIGDVVEADDRAFERTPETLTGTARQLTQGVVKLAGRLLLVLDTDEVVRGGGRAPARGAGPRAQGLLPIAEDVS